VENFKNWELIYNAKLVSVGHINVALLHQVIAQAMRDNAGSIGYLIGEDSTDLIGDGADE
jgi:hypothetical protein